MEDVVAALVNFLPKPMDVEGNLSSMELFVAEAVSKEADLVCFPELSTAGYVLPDITRFAEPMDGPTVKRICDISEEYGVCISAGFVETDSKWKYITHILAEKGKIVGKYRKTHLGHNERNFFNAGDSISVFDTSFGKVGICLCWESRFPEITRVLAVKGAEIVLIPYASGPGGETRKTIWNKYLPTRASDDTTYVLACNMMRIENNEVAGGGAVALDYKGRTIAEDYPSSENVVIAKLDATKLAEARKGGTMGDNYYIKERKPELYGDLVAARSVK